MSFYFYMSSFLDIYIFWILCLKIINVNILYYIVKLYDIDSSNNKVIIKTFKNLYN